MVIFNGKINNTKKKMKMRIITCFGDRKGSGVSYNCLGQGSPIIKGVTFPASIFLPLRFTSGP